MTSLARLSTEDLRRALAIKQRIEQLEAELDRIASASPLVKARLSARMLSAAGRERIAQAQKKRWARYRRTHPQSSAAKAQPKLSVHTRARLAEAARRR